MICLEILETGERRKIDNEVWVRRQRNGMVVRCLKPRAQGVGDGESIWSLGSLEGYPEAKKITLAEYEETMGALGEAELSAEEALEIIVGGIYDQNESDEAANAH